jgi:hypothetical protein
MISARCALRSDAADQNLIELIVKSLGGGIFIQKLTAIHARPQVPRSLSVAVPPGVAVSLASMVSPGHQNCHGESQREPCHGHDLLSKRTLCWREELVRPPIIARGRAL